MADEETTTPQTEVFRDKERIRLLEFDLSQTNDFVKGVLTTGAALRTSGITIWLTLLGFSVQQHLAELALLAALVSCLFWVLDGYHGWLYTEASKHVRSIEQLLAAYYNHLSRSQDSPNSSLRFLSALRAHRYGHQSSFKTRFNVGAIWFARPSLFYRILYPGLIAFAVVAFTLIGLDIVGKQTPPRPIQVVIGHSR